MKNGLFIFRRDLRIEDNIGLALASKKCENLYCCFIFTPEQITSQNHYISDSAVQFMMESLQELGSALAAKGGELLCFYGKNEDILKVLIKQLQITGTFFNRDYTPYARERDASIVKICENLGIGCETFEDYYLYQPGTVFSGSGNIYKKFKPFYDKVLQIEVPKIGEQQINNESFLRTSRQLEHRIRLHDAIARFSSKHLDLIVSGGRKNGLRN